jgi:IclR family pca regulon transcriptional regulator
MHGPEKRQIDSEYNYSQRERMGYSINNQEYLQGLICIYAQLINYRTNKVTGAISFDLPADGYTVESVISTYAGQVTKLANDISGIMSMNES